MASGIPTGGFAFPGGSQPFGTSASSQGTTLPTPSFGFNAAAASQTPAFGSGLTAAPGAAHFGSAFGASPGTGNAAPGFNFNPQAASFSPQQAAQQQQQQQQQQPLLFGQNAPAHAIFAAPTEGFGFGGGHTGLQVKMFNS